MNLFFPLELKFLERKNNHVLEMMYGHVSLSSNTKCDHLLPL